MSAIVMSANGKMNLKIPGNIPTGFYTLIIQYDNIRQYSKLIIE